MSSSGIKYTTQWWLLVLIPAIPTIRVYNALQVSPLGTALSHQVPASLHDQNHTPVSARSHQESSSHSDAHAPWYSGKYPRLSRGRPGFDSPSGSHLLNPAHTGRINQKMMDSGACVENLAFISSQEKNPATRYIQYKIRIQRVDTFQNPYISLSD